MAGSPVSALRRQPGLAAVRGAIDEPVSADHPAVLLIGEAEPAQPGEHVLPELGALPRRLPGLVPHDLARGAHRPARAVGQLSTRKSGSTSGYSTSIWSKAQRWPPSVVRAMRPSMPEARPRRASVMYTP